MNRFVQVFGRQRVSVIGMVHVQALPGSPKNMMTMNEIVERSCKEAEIYRKAEFDGIILENMHDVPWARPEDLGPETVASMTVVAAAVRKENPLLPIGIQILSSANKEAVAVAKTAGLNFIRAEGWVYAHIGDEGYTQSCAAMVTRYRRQLLADDVLLFTDVKKKHSSHSITSDVSIASTAQAAETFCSDGIIITGSSTGVAASLEDVKEVQAAVKLPVLIGSGITIENVDRYLHVNGLIVGSHFKHGGQWNNEIAVTRVERFMDRVNQLRNKH